MGNDPEIKRLLGKPRDGDDVVYIKVVWDHVKGGYEAVMSEVTGEGEEDWGFSEVADRGSDLFDVVEGIQEGLESRFGEDGNGD